MIAGKTPLPALRALLQAFHLLEKQVPLILPLNHFYPKSIPTVFRLPVQFPDQAFLLCHTPAILFPLRNIGIIIKYRYPEKASQIDKDITAAGCTAAMEEQFLSFIARILQYFIQFFCIIPFIHFPCLLLVPFDVFPKLPIFRLYTCPGNKLRFIVSTDMALCKLHFLPRRLARFFFCPQNVIQIPFSVFCMGHQHPWLKKLPSAASSILPAKGSLLSFYFFKGLCL